MVKVVCDLFKVTQGRSVVFGQPFRIKGGHIMLHMLPVVCLSVTPWYRFETVQHSGLKFYRMVGQGLGSGAERHPKDGTVSEQWR